MADEKKEEEPSIFKVDTVPPPAGDGDAYNAPTKVGPVSAEAWSELIEKANEEGKRDADAAKLVGDAAPLSRPARREPVEEAPPPISKSAPLPKISGDDEEEVPRVYDEEDLDESNAATLLNPNAKKLQDSSVRADASVFGNQAAIPAPKSEPPPDDILAPQSRRPKAAIFVVIVLALLAAGAIYMLTK